MRAGVRACGTRSCVCGGACDSTVCERDGLVASLRALQRVAASVSDTGGGGGDCSLARLERPERSHEALSPPRPPRRRLLADATPSCTAAGRRLPDTAASCLTVCPAPARPRRLHGAIHVWLHNTGQPKLARRLDCPPRAGRETRVSNSCAAHSAVRDQQPLTHTTIRRRNVRKEQPRNIRD